MLPEYIRVELERLRAENEMHRRVLVRITESHRYGRTPQGLAIMALRGEEIE